MAPVKALHLLRAWMAEAPNERTSRRIAKCIGISGPAVSAYLSGHTRPKWQYRDLIARLTGVPVEAWLTPREAQQYTRARARIDALAASGEASAAEGGAGASGAVAS